MVSAILIWGSFRASSMHSGLRPKRGTTVPRFDHTSHGAGPALVVVYFRRQYSFSRRPQVGGPSTALDYKDAIALPGASQYCSGTVLPIQAGFGIDGSIKFVRAPISGRRKL